MKPDFALSLSFDGLRLLHRSGETWLSVGDVALDDADLTGALARLRARGEALAGGPVECKLILPNEQVKYIALDTTRAEEDDVRAALDGATPYPVDELVYDFAKGGGRTYIAAVAQETLDEAEGFARENGFVPLGFAAAPEPFTYVGEPVFAALDGGDRDALRDPEPVVAQGVAEIPEGYTDPEKELPPTEPEPTTQPAELAEAVAESVEAAQNTGRSGPELMSDEVGETVAADVEHATADEDSPVFGSARNLAMASETPDVLPQDGKTDRPAPVEGAAPVFGTTRTADAAPDVRAEAAGDAPAGEITPDAEAAQTSAPDAKVARAAADTSETLWEPGPEAPPVFGSARSAGATDDQLRSGADDEAPLFGTSRNPDIDPSDAGLRRDPPPLAVPISAPDHGPRLGAPARVENVTSPAAHDLRAEASPAPGAAPPITGRTGPDTTQDAAPPVPAPEPESDARSAAATLAPAHESKGGFRSRRGTQQPESADVAQPARKPFFNARKTGRDTPKKVVGGKPRYLGLILTGVLILLLIAAGFFLAGPREIIESLFRRDAPVVAETTELAAAQEDEPAAPDALAASTEVPAVTEAPAAPEPTAAAGAPVPPGQVLSPDEAQRIYAATGVWQRAPRLTIEPRSEALGPLAITATEPAPARSAAPATLETSTAFGDTVFPVPFDPPPPEAEFNFGDNGRVVATPEGALSPGGVLVYANAPRLLPPVRPGTEAPPATVPLAEGAEPVPDAPEGVDLIAGAPAVTPPIREPEEIERTAPELSETGLSTVDTTQETPGAEIAGPLPEADMADTAVAEPQQATLDAAPANEAPSTVTAPQTGPPLLAGAVAEALAVANGPIAETETTAPGSSLDTPETLAPALDNSALRLANRPDTLSEPGADAEVIFIADRPEIAPAIRPGTEPPAPERAAAPDAGEDTVRFLDERPATDLAIRPDIATSAPETAPVPEVSAEEMAAAIQRPGPDTPRPAPRPASLADAAIELTTPVDPGTRPRIRPAGLAPEADPTQEPAPTATPVEAASGLVLDDELARAIEEAASRPDPFATATAQAVPQSLRPDSRPRNMDRIVAQARETAVTQAATTPAQPAQVARPSGPTATTVARAATIENAMNLRDINLIGVYNRNDGRFALVRLSNGRLARVRVGDRLDGGQVTAISDNALNYVKRGRTITLQIPSG